MRIKEVESRTGLTAKAIRLYESKGLLKPARETENDYRDYTEEDVARLKTIAILRKLDVPVKTIKEWTDGKTELRDILQKAAEQNREASRENDFYRQQSKFTQALATFAKRHKVHMHLVVHPRKSQGGSKKEANNETADDVSGSGDITNRADNVFFLTMHSVSSTGADGGTPVQKPLLKILKNRNFGARGEIWLDFDKKSRRYFQDRTCNAERPMGWDPAAGQMEIQNAIPESNDAVLEDTFTEITEEENSDVPF